MKFRTEIELQRGNFSLTPERGVMLAGSCFAQNIERCMRESLWAAVNPYGVLFNPFSIAKLIKISLQGATGMKREIERSVFESKGVWHSWLAGTSCSGTNAAEVEDMVLRACKEGGSLLRNAQCLIVTFGTAYCYYLGEECGGGVVANCHKQPADMFTRRRVSVSEIVEEWSGVIEKVRDVNPELKIIFTVSPVRHLRDGFADNSRSKAVLMLAIEELIEQYEGCDYFPAYEIVSDDLRDYRFYSDDMVHPSQQAVDYIWEKFADRYLSTTDIRVLKEGEKLNRRLNHRPNGPGGDEWKKFNEETERLLAEFRRTHPGMLGEKKK